MERTDVLIVGAGPTGLTLALWLTKQGVAVRIIDKAAQAATASRALAVQARTLELYRQLDLTEAVLAAGHAVPGANMWAGGKKVARIDFTAVDEGLTPYGPFIFPQDRHERLLGARLEAMGVAIERQKELRTFVEEGDHVIATLATPTGDEIVQAAYIAGCDGARSVVRETIGVGFPGGTYQKIFYVADVDALGPSIDGELHVDLDESDFLALFPIDDHGRVRLIGTVQDEQHDKSDTLRFEDVSNRAITNMKVKVERVNWFSTYRVHHRVTEKFRKGRAFLLGDAAHIHSPAGGQGMNTGIGDAINLAWKLKSVVKDGAGDTLLDTYETERRAFAKVLVATTDKAFTLATAEGRIADFIRLHVVPLLLPNVLRFHAAREFIFGAVTQIALAYHGSPLSRGRTGQIEGGDRLPWAPAPGADNFDTLSQLDWQVHVYGTADPATRTWCQANNVALNVFRWQPAHEKAGFVQNALYLVRPDSYIGLASPSQESELLSTYFAELRLDPPRRARAGKPA